MKSNIFLNAIRSRNLLKFLYGLEETCIEPYYISYNKEGRKVIYGRVNSTKEIKKFEFDRIVNIRIINTKKFSPVIPIIPMAV